MLNAQRLVTLGALVADAVHTRPVPLTGFSTDAGVQGKFVERNVNRANYQGPTGIVGTLHNLTVQEGIPAASLWAATPYYLGSTPNPKTALGLLETLDDALDLHLNLSELRTVVRRIRAAGLDGREGQRRSAGAHPRARAAYDERAPEHVAELPETGAIIADLETFLREKRAGE